MLRHSIRQFALLALAMAAACGPREPAVDDLPNVAVDGFAPVLREQIEQGRQQLARNSRDGDACGRIAIALHAAGYLEAASDWYRRARLLDPDNPRWSVFLAYSLEASGDLHGAIAAIERARVALPSDPEVTIKMADLLRMDQRLTEADALYGSLHDDPTWAARALYGSGMVAMDQGRLEDAALLLGRARELRPRTPEIRYALATVYRRQGKPAASEQELAVFERERIVAGAFMGPIPFEVARLSLVAERQVASRSVDRDMITAGILNFEGRLLSDPDDRSAHVALVALYGARRQLARATEHYEAAKASQPDDADLDFVMGNILLAAGKLDQARRHYDQAIAARRGFALAYLQRGQAWERQGFAGNALQDYEAAVQLAPEDPIATRLLGRRLALEGRMDEAAALVRSDADRPLDAWELLVLAGTGPGTADRLAAAVARAEETGDREVLEAALALEARRGASP